jgi:hypothetical protein
VDAAVQPELVEELQDEPKDAVRQALPAPLHDFETQVPKDVFDLALGPGALAVVGTAAVVAGPEAELEAIGVPDGAVPARSAASSSAVRGVELPVLAAVTQAALPGRYVLEEE